MARDATGVIVVGALALVLLAGCYHPASFAVKAYNLSKQQVEVTVAMYESGGNEIFNTSSEMGPEIHTTELGRLVLKPGDYRVDAWTRNLSATEVLALGGSAPWVEVKIRSDATNIYRAIE